MTAFYPLVFPKQIAQTKKDQGLRPSFAHVQLRQGRSPLLPTLPYQQINRYAVVDEVAIRFYLIILKKNRILSRIHVTNFSYTSFVLLKELCLLIPNSHTIRRKWILNVRKYSNQSDEGRSNIWCRW